MRALAFGFLLLWLPLTALRAEVPAPLSPWVSDYAHVLNPGQEAALSTQLSAIRAQTGVHIAMATLQRRSDFRDYPSLEALALDMFNTWGIGDRIRNDGILVLVATEDREIRVQLGAGYEPVWDNRAQRVIDVALAPPMTDGRFFDGLTAGATALSEYIAQPFAAGQRFTGTEGMPEAPDDGGDLRGMLIFLGIAGGFILWVQRREMKEALSRFRPCPSCGKRNLRPEERTDHGAKTSAKTWTCAACGWHQVLPLPYHDPADAPARASVQDGDGGGFGGGQSSGGGASGRF